MTFEVQFVRIRRSDNWIEPVGLPMQVVALSADEAMWKLKRVAETGKWPPNVDAARLFENGVEIDSFILALDANPGALDAQAA